MEQKRTIERLWRDGRRGRADDAGVPRSGRRRVAAALLDEAAERVESYANGLLALGVRKGDAFAILGSSRVEWALFDFALGSVGAIGAAIYANSSPKDAGYILAHSESIGVLCEDESQRAKVESVRGDAPELRHVLTYADLDDLAARGRAYAAEHPNALREAGSGSRRATSSPTSTRPGRPGRPRAA
jgi:long-chain acyl-CoA synthetase